MVNRTLIQMFVVDFNNMFPIQSLPTYVEKFLEATAVFIHSRIFLQLNELKSTYSMNDQELLSIVMMSETEEETFVCFLCVVFLCCDTIAQARAVNASVSLLFTVQYVEEDSEESNEIGLLCICSIYN